MYVLQQRKMPNEQEIQECDVPHCAGFHCAQQNRCYGKQKLVLQQQKIKIVYSPKYST